MHWLFQLYLTKLPLFFGAVFYRDPTPAQCLAQKTSSGFFGLPKWYKYLSYQPNSTSHRCEIVLPHGGLTSNYWLIGVAILDMLFRIAGMVAIVFVIWGGFTYLTSQGEPNKLAEARQTILNALIGAIIAIMSVVIVSFIGNRLGG